MILITLSIFIVIVFLIVLVKQGFTIPCVFFKVTGLKCPGCGNTRAAIAIANMDFLKSLEYNPLFLPELFYILWVYSLSAINYMKGEKDYVDNTFSDCFSISSIHPYVFYSCE
jgi:hypothetical protein